MAWGRAVAEDTLQGLTEQLGAQIPDAELAAIKQLALIVRRQATVLSFADVFLALTLLFASLALFALMMRKPAAAAPADAH